MKSWSTGLLAIPALRRLRIEDRGHPGLLCEFQINPNYTVRYFLCQKKKKRRKERKKEEKKERKKEMYYEYLPTSTKASHVTFVFSLLKWFLSPFFFFIF